MATVTVDLGAGDCLLDCGPALLNLVHCTIKYTVSRASGHENTQSVFWSIFWSVFWSIPCFSHVLGIAPRVATVVSMVTLI